jgi:hypothetical protein
MLKGLRIKEQFYSSAARKVISLDQQFLPVNLLVLQRLQFG